MIIVLHAAACDTQLYLWAESTSAGTEPPRRRGRPPKLVRPRPHPQAADEGQLAAALSAAGLHLKTPPAETVILWLPSARGLPLPSSPLLGGQAADPHVAPALIPWTASALPVSPAQQIGLLFRCLNGPALAPGVVAGADLRFWALGLRFAGSLVARQRYLPGVCRDSDGGWRARWCAAPTGSDTARLSALARTMPAACRAVIPAGPEGNPTGPLSEPIPSRVFRRSRALCLHRRDRRCRRQDGRRARPLLRGETRRPRQPAGSGRATPFDSLHAQWMHALCSPDGSLQGDEAELAALAASVAEWRHRLAGPRLGPLPAGVSPGGAGGGRWPGEGSWLVRFLLQAADDPSLLVSAAEAWKARGSGAAAVPPAGCESS